MDRALLNFKYNACRIDLEVAGMEAKASGFLYITAPACRYNYVLTAKHTFSEDERLEPEIKRIKNVHVYYLNSHNQKTESLKLVDKQIDKSILFFKNCDLAILKVEKIVISDAELVVVKNADELLDERILRINGFPALDREKPVGMDFQLKDKDDGVVCCTSGIKNIEYYHGISGSGIYCSDAPYLISVISQYTYKGFELEYMQLSVIDWDRINGELIHNNWSRLNRGSDRYVYVTEEQEVINIQDLRINGVSLDLDWALKNLRYDIHDDWFFDPLYYKDMCNSEFVLKYFSKKEARDEYKSQKMENFYIPKKSMVLRKAMIGSFIDRLIYTAVVQKLTPLIDSHLSMNVYAARYNEYNFGNGLIVNGVEQWRKMNYQINDWVEAGDGCLVKCDLLNYYDSINKKILIRLLGEIAKSDEDKQAITLLSDMLEQFADKEVVHGLPQNCDASSILATFYVSHIDEFVQIHARHYCRFMDDMYFIAPDFYEARNLLQAIEKELRQLDLSVNAQKVEFVKLNRRQDKEKFAKSLPLYDHMKEQIKLLMQSSSIGKRSNAIALLVKEINCLMKKREENDDKELDRSMKFCLYALTSYKLRLDSYWGDFYNNLKLMVDNLKDYPLNTPIVCRLIAAIDSRRDIEEVKKSLSSIAMRKNCDIYEWQAYHLWLLLAYLKYDHKELIKYAVQEVERNDETKRIEVAAIFIYIVTVRKEYARLLLHRLRDGQIHGYMQCRACLIACRAIDSKAIDEISLSNLPSSLASCHRFLNRYANKELVLFGNVSSHLLPTNNTSIFPDLYSGL